MTWSLSWYCLVIHNKEDIMQILVTEYFLIIFGVTRTQRLAEKEMKS